MKADCPSEKAGYSMAVAKRKAKSASRRYDEAFAAYQCRQCGEWHFGHMARKAKPLRLIHRFHEMRGTA